MGRGATARTASKAFNRVTFGGYRTTILMGFTF
jgi:hypothetical protein